MTQNQIAYWTLREQQRTNRRNEEAKFLQNYEAIRANKAREAIQAETNAINRSRVEVQNALDARRKTLETINTGTNIAHAINDTAATISKAAASALFA